MTASSQINKLCAQIRPLDEQAMAAAQARQNSLTKPPGSLGRLEALSIHPYRFGKEDSLETFEPDEVPGLIKPGPSWARALRLHQIGIMKQEEQIILENE